MKKLITLALILLPMVAMAQKEDTKTTKQFFDKYSEIQGYEYLEVNEQMFKQFREIEGMDKEMLTFLMNLKFIRFLEYKSSGKISVASHIPGNGIKSLGGGRVVEIDGHLMYSSPNVTYVKGVLVPVAGVATKKDSLGGTIRDSLRGTKVAGRSYLTIPADRSSMLYNRAKKEIDLKNFTQLMKANQDGEKMIFLKRAAGGGVTEYLLIIGNTMINIMGTLDIRHINEIEEILEAVGEILPL